MPEILPTIALVGAPNVGKSTLFNSILGKRQAVTGPTPGTTRDRSYSPAEWNGKKMIFIDTGGLARKSDDPLEQDIRQQSEIAMSEADVILFVVDHKQPDAMATQAAKELRSSLRKHKLQNKVPVILVANKVDSPKDITQAEIRFRKTGFGEALTVSAVSGRGIGDLLDKVVDSLEQVEVPEIEKEVFATVSFVGRPNVGKSTLLNSLAGQQRAVVSDIAGTTRAAVEINVPWQDKTISFIDTAGLRRRARVDLEIEEYSLFQTYKSIESSDVVVLLLDGSEEPARFDKTIAGKLKEAAKGIVIAVNKIDLVPKDAIDEIANAIKVLFPFLRFADVVPISAEKGYNIDKLLEAIARAREARGKIVPEEDLSAAFKSWVKKYPPRWIRGQKKPKVFAFKQVRSNPPTFDMIVNEPPSIHFSYVRYIENQLRQTFDFAGTAVRIRVRKPER